MNPDLEKLQPYPFEKLANLKAGIVPPADLKHIALSIGEPKHAAPQLIYDAINSNMSGLSVYPLTAGSSELRTAIAQWATRRYNLKEGSLDPERNVLPVNGSREAIFAFAQCVVNPISDALVLMPNPFYQIYEGATILAGAQPYFLNTTKETDFLPDLSTVREEIWDNCQLLYICSPGNPTGKVYDLKLLEKLLQLSEKFNFILASDECYSEIYFDENPPPGLLQACAAVGLNSYQRCIVFHSLPKRTIVPGMRSGFVAGDATLMDRFRLFRTYHGSAMSPLVQAASTLAWQDEKHVVENRKLYQEKFDRVLSVLGNSSTVARPDGAFYLWMPTPYDDVAFTKDLYQQCNITVLPGSFMSRRAHGINPGAGYVRIALVDSIEVCEEAAQRVRNFLRNYVKSEQPVTSGN